MLLGLLAGLEAAAGDREAATALEGRRGFVDPFLVCGPFGAAPNAGLYEAYGPELAAARRELRLNERFPALRGDRGWVPVGRDPRRTAVRLRDALSGQGAVSYAMTHIRSDREREAFLVYSGPSAQVWVNRAPSAVVDRARERLDREVRVPITLRAGWNRVLLKLTGGPRASFSLQLADSDGGPLLLPANTAPRPVEVGPRAGGAAAPLASFALATLQADEDPDRRALCAYAFLLAGLSEEAAVLLEDLSGEAPALLALPRFHILVGVAAQNAGHLPQAVRRDRARTAYEAALELDPRSVEARRRLSEFALQDDRPVDAVRLLEAVLADFPDDVGTRLRLVELLRGQGWELAAERELDEAARRSGDLLPILQRRVALLERRGRLEEAEEVRAAILALEPGQVWVLVRRIDQALAEGDPARARAALDEYERRADPDDAEIEGRRVRLLRALGDRPGELLALRASLAARPHDAERRLELARRLCEDALRAALAASVEPAAVDAVGHGQGAAREVRDEALALLDELLADAPERHDVRRLRRELVRATGGVEPEEERFWAEWEPDLAEVLAGAPDASHWPGASTVCLFDQTVTRIYPDTSSVEAVHQVWRILDESGKERYASRQDSGEVLEVRTITPDGRVLEPIRVGTGAFQMPALGPGAVVEHAFKVERRAESFQLAGGPFYFMDPSLTEPFWFSRWVVWVHEDAPVALDERNLDREGITREVEQRGEWKVYVFTARDQPRVEPEPFAPDPSEVLPWARVIEPRTLDEIGSLYREWALSSQVVTPTVRRKAEELVAGLATDSERTRALFDFVQRHVTRPGSARAPSEVLASRGGSKSALLMALLRAAGVPAQVAFAGPGHYDPTPVDWLHPEPGQFRTQMIRVAPRDGNAPFALYVENHRYAPYKALPFAHWHAPLFLTDPDGGGLEVLPGGGLDEERVVSTIRIALLAGGQGRVSIAQELPALGLYAAKENFASARPQQLRAFFAQQANQRFPGARLLETATPGLEDVGVPLSFSFSMDAERVVRPRGDGTLELRGHLSPAGLREAYAGQRQRVFDVVVTQPVVLRETIEVELGPYVCPLLPGDVAISERFGQFSLVHRRTGADTLRIERRLVLRPGRIAPRDYVRFRAFLERIEAAERIPLIVEERG